MADCIIEGTTIRTDAVFIPRGETVPADPDTVSLTIRAPGGTSQTYSYGGPGSPIDHDGPGLYHADHTPDQPGTWWYSWKASSPVPGINAVGETRVVIEGSVV